MTINSLSACEDAPAACHQFEMLPRQFGCGVKCLGNGNDSSSTFPLTSRVLRDGSAQTQREEKE